MQSLTWVLLLEAGIFSGVVCLITGEVRRRAREHRAGLISQISTFLGDLSEEEAPPAWIRWMRTARYRAIQAYDEAGWYGVAKVLSVLCVGYLITAGCTAGSVLLVSLF